MSDGEDITVSTPTVSPPEPAPSNAETIEGAFRENLKIVSAGTEDATDYIRERDVQEKHRGGKDISNVEQAEWHTRHAAALKRAADAARAARGEPPASEQQSPTELPGYVSPDAPDWDARFAEAKVRFDEYFDNPERIGGSLTAQDHKAQITEWLQTYDPAGKLTGHFMASPLGPQMAEVMALEGGPDLIKHVASMPPATRAANMSKLEGYLYARNEQQQHQNGLQRAHHPPPRQWSAAPPPMSRVKGAANVPQDVLSLANKNNADDYIKARRAQEKRAAEDR
jgi:hypothetical protein